MNWSFALWLGDFSSLLFMSPSERLETNTIFTSLLIVFHCHMLFRENYTIIPPPHTDTSTISLHKSLTHLVSQFCVQFTFIMLHSIVFCLNFSHLYSRELGFITDWWSGRGLRLFFSFPQFGIVRKRASSSAIFPTI